MPEYPMMQIFVRVFEVAQRYDDQVVVSGRHPRAIDGIVRHEGTRRLAKVARSMVLSSVSRSSHSRRSSYLYAVLILLNKCLLALDDETESRLRPDC